MQYTYFGQLEESNPFELALGRKHPSYLCYRYICQIKANLRAKTDVLKRKKLQKFRDSRLALQNKDKKFHGYTVRKIIYMYHPRGSLLQTASKKIKCEFVGPLAI